jgi:hypothetical protein
MKESRLPIGIEDVIIFPLVLAALAAKNLFQADDELHLSCR